MKRLQRMLTLIAFLYILYHMYTFGIGALNGTLLVMCFISFYLEVMRERRQKEDLRKKQAQAATEADKEHR